MLGRPDESSRRNAALPSLGGRAADLFEDYADGHFMTIYGEPVPERVQLARAGHIEQHMKFFSFVKGLDSAGS